MADEVLPTSSPSPSSKRVQVSTQTRSPMPSGRIAVTVNGTSGTRSPSPFTSVATRRTASGSFVASTTPATPFSSAPRASRASSSEPTRA
jgi:hypothetical protein